MKCVESTLARSSAGLVSVMLMPFCLSFCPAVLARTIDVCNGMCSVQAHPLRSHQWHTHSHHHLSGGSIKRWCTYNGNLIKILFFLAALFLFGRCSFASAIMLLSCNMACTVRPLCPCSEKWNETFYALPVSSLYISIQFFLLFFFPVPRMLAARLLWHSFDTKEKPCTSVSLFNWNIFVVRFQ